MISNVILFIQKINSHEDIRCHNIISDDSSEYCPLHRKHEKKKIVFLSESESESDEEKKVEIIFESDSSDKDEKNINKVKIQQRKNTIKKKVKIIFESEDEVEEKE